MHVEWFSGWWVNPGSQLQFMMPVVGSVLVGWQIPMAEEGLRLKLSLIDELNG